MAEHDSANPLHDVEAALTAAQNERTAIWNTLKEAWRARELKAVLKACGNLALKECVVAKKAALLNLKAISIVLKTVKDVVIEFCNNSLSPKTAAVSYSSFTVGGNGYQAAFSFLNDINSFKGAGLSDIFFPISLLLLTAILGVSIVAALLLAVLICLPIPGYAELLAGSFQWAFKRTWLKAGLSIGFVIFSVLVSVGGIGSSVPEKIAPVSREILKDKVTIKTVPPSPVKDGTYLRVNENSTYMFVQSLDPNDTSIERVAVSQIAYITVNDGEREPGPASPVHELSGRIEKELTGYAAKNHEHAGYAAKDHGHKNDENVDPKPGRKLAGYAAKNHEHAGYAAKDHEHNYAAAGHKHKPNASGASHEHANYITEDLLRTRINKEMACDGGEDTQISGFIRFNKGSAKFNDFAANSKEIEKFVSKRGQATEWVVFGFASPDGEQRVNNPLSSKRANTVRKELCSALNGSRPELKCEEDINIKEAGEDYPINGVANSRSARIAACTKNGARP